MGSVGALGSAHLHLKFPFDVFDVVADCIGCVIQ